MKIVIQIEEKTYTYDKKSEIEAIKTQLDGIYWITPPTCIEKWSKLYNTYTDNGEPKHYWIDREHTITIPTHTIIDIDYIHDKSRELKKKN